MYYNLYCISISLTSLPYMLHVTLKKWCGPNIHVIKITGNQLSQEQDGMTEVHNKIQTTCNS